MKRYIQEEGTERVNDLCRQATEVILCAISIPEVVSAFMRLRREKKIKNSLFQYLKKDFLGDVAEADLINISEPILKNAIIAIEKGPIRTLEVIQP